MSHRMKVLRDKVQIHILYVGTALSGAVAVLSTLISD